MTPKEIKAKGGNAFISKESGKLCLIRCPECQQENYVLNVMSGCCTWCDYNANEKSKT